MGSEDWEIHHAAGKRRVIVTKRLPGQRWLDMLAGAGCRVEVCRCDDILDGGRIAEAIGSRCDGAIGQLTEPWTEEVFAFLKAAGGKAYSNYAVGFNNVDVAAAVRCGLPVGNTPGVLTDTTAEMAIALTFAAARRTGEAERFMRAGRYRGWLPTLFLGDLLMRKTVGIVGAGRIGAAYGRMMVEGHRTDLLYCDPHRNTDLERDVAAYGALLAARGEPPVECRRVETVDELLRRADVVSLHTLLNGSTRHLIDARRLALMKPNAILVNTSRGPVIDETALVAHCRSHPGFRAALDVFENEPETADGLVELDNVTVVPHIASATGWTREAMAVLAAGNVAAMLLGYPVWSRDDMTPFLGENPPKAAPSIVNASELGLPVFGA